MEAHAGRGVKPGLERIRGVLDLLADPHQGYAVIHVTGTNGKTSTVTFASAILAAHDLSVGSFVSPHLQRVEERFALNGVMMTPSQFTAAVEDVAAQSDFYERRSGQLVTYFELTTAIALAWFAEKAVDVAVVEVGLGGRLDSTNVFDAAVAVITGIGIEHTEYLGPTLGRIAAEKAAILKPGGALVTGPLPAEAELVIAARVAETGAPWRRSGAEYRMSDPERGEFGWVFSVDGVYDHYEDIELAVRGIHQVRNFTVALVACEELISRALDVEAVRSAAASTLVPGRLEVVGDDPLVILDGAHNTGGFEALAAALDVEFAARRWVLVFGAMGDKDIEGMLALLRGKVVSVVATQAAGTRPVDAGRVASTAAAVLGVPVTAQPVVAEALESAMGAALGSTGVLVAGSLYLVGEAREILGGGG